MIRNRAYQVSVKHYGQWSRAWIDRKNHISNMWDITLERAASVRDGLPAGGILTEYEDGWSWMLPNFGRRGNLT